MEEHSISRTAIEDQSNERLMTYVLVARPKPRMGSGSKQTTQHQLHSPQGSKRKTDAQMVETKGQTKNRGSYIGTIHETIIRQIDHKGKVKDWRLRRKTAETGLKLVRNEQGNKCGVIRNEKRFCAVNTVRQGTND
jgi:hypothetical protein